MFWHWEPRVQRREFRDYQPLSMMVAETAVLPAATRREFACVTGTVWRQYHTVTRRARDRRLTMLFLAGADQALTELLLVGCDCLRRGERQYRTLYVNPSWPIDDALARRLCVDHDGRSVLPLSALHLPATAGGDALDARPPLLPALQERPPCL
ncbi:hypothetical protein ABXN37_12610 [Piscinibacter sakaiensis]|uniref:Uncharacterized protein n=1 Tax=Piscinibacter sakaiensis TaxID=1547922 RepID=A0A0K8P008_PISS1|nr:hypothetical protein [Piscinibacter sakaiensis]GAP35987.1 hypothetical protein ISF6_1827 [Piscinibacter sakaiensis]